VAKKREPFLYWSSKSRGEVFDLYRMDDRTGHFAVWFNDEWVLCQDRYLRVTRDAYYKDIAPEHAVEIQQMLSEKAKLKKSLQETEEMTEAAPVATLQDHGAGASFSSTEGGIKATLSVPTSMFSQLEDPSALKTASIAMHELFLSFLSAGFTEDQALKLIGNILRTGE
jgi:hypothetical protein